MAGGTSIKVSSTHDNRCFAVPLCACVLLKKSCMFKSVDGNPNLPWLWLHPPGDLLSDIFILLPINIYQCLGFFVVVLFCIHLVKGSISWCDGIHIFKKKKVLLWFYEFLKRPPDDDWCWYTCSVFWCRNPTLNKKNGKARIEKY